MSIIYVRKGLTVDVLDDYVEGKFKVGREVYGGDNISPGDRVTLVEKSYKYAIVLTDGNGDCDVNVYVSIGSESYTATGCDWVIDVVADDTLKVEVENPTSDNRTAPKLIVGYIEW